MEGKLNEAGQENLRLRLTVPSGFRNLLEGLTMEILRSNPSDIYTFAAEYFKSRLQEREGGSFNCSVRYFSVSIVKRLCPVR